MNNKSLKELYENVKGNVIGKMDYHDGAGIWWIINDYNKFYIDEDYFDYDVKIKRKSLILGKEKYKRLNIGHWHPNGDFNQIYEEIMNINHYFKKNNSLEGYINSKAKCDGKI